MRPAEILVHVVGAGSRRSATLNSATFFEMSLLLAASLAVEALVLRFLKRVLRRPGASVHWLTAALAVPIVLAVLSASPVGTSWPSVIPFVALFGLYLMWAVRHAYESAAIRRRQERELH